MDIDDIILVSVDDHVVEPAHLFERWAPANVQDQAPKYIVKPDGTEVWSFLGVEMRNVGLNAVAGRPPDEYGLEPTSRAEMRPGCYDVSERVQDMDANGVLGSLCFGSITGFTGQLFARPDDKELGRTLLQAYNDWHIEEWCGTHPGRFIPLATAPIWNPQWMAEEMRRVAKKDVHAVTFSENPSKLGYPSFHSDHWDPFWQACSDLGIVVCLHIGSSSQLIVTAPDAPIRRDHRPHAYQHRPGRGRPPVLTGPPQVSRSPIRPLGGGNRLDSLLPRAGGLLVPAPSCLDRPGLRGPAPEPGVQFAGGDLLHR